VEQENAILLVDHFIRLNALLIQKLLLLFSLSQPPIDLVLFSMGVDRIGNATARSLHDRCVPNDRRRRSVDPRRNGVGCNSRRNPVLNAPGDIGTKRNSALPEIESRKLDPTFGHSSPTMISAVAMSQERTDHHDEVDDSFTCRTDQTTVRASNVRRVAVRGMMLLCRDTPAAVHCKNTFLIHLYPSLFH
jgi:hypothetical protein